MDPQPNAIGLLWLHGGGYAIGTPEQDAKKMSIFIKSENCVIIAPDYRLSTETPYPAAINDCYNSLVWMKDHAQELGINDEQLFVTGNSAGGGLTAAVSLMARDRNEVNIAFQMPLYPMIDDRMNTYSVVSNDAPIWDSQANYHAWRLYLGYLFGTDNVPKYAAPSRENNYENLPPTYTFVGDIEPFYDETRIYIENLQKAGIKAEIDVYPGCFHAFDTIGGNKGISQVATQTCIQKFKYAAQNYTHPQK